MAEATPPATRRAPPRLSTNALANALGFAANAGIGILFTPYLVRHLGVGVYGILPLATTLSAYLAVLTLVVNAAVGRFITLCLERDEQLAASRYFNTSLFSSIGVAFVLVVPAFLVAWYPQAIFRIPAGQESETTKLLAYTGAVVIVSVVSAPFEVATFCRNRFDIRNFITVVATLGRVAIVVVAFSMGRPRLSHVGAATLASSLASFAASVVAWRKLTPELVVRWSDAGRRPLRELMHSGGWVAVSQVGTLLLLSIDLLVVNRLFGADAGGRYASVLQWPIVLRSVALTLAGVLGPTVIALYARGDNNALARYTRTTVKALGLFMALPVGIMSGLSRQILTAWLGPSFLEWAPLLTVMVLPLSVNLGYLPLHNISTATNKVRLPGIIQVLAGAANLVLALCLARRWGVYGVAVAGILVLTFRNVLFTPLYGAAIIGRGRATFMREVPTIFAATLFVALASWSAGRWLNLTTWKALFAFGVFASLMYVPFVWKLCLSQEERQLLKR